MTNKYLEKIAALSIVGKALTRSLVKPLGSSVQNFNKFKNVATMATAKGAVGEQAASKLQQVGSAIGHTTHSGEAVRATKLALRINRDKIKAMA